MKVSGILLLATLAGCNQTGTSPYGEPFDQIAGFAGTPVMQPGADCMQCHVAGGAASDRIWTVAGTVFSSPTACAFFTPDAGTGCAGGVQGVQVLLTDANGQQLTLTTNEAGNFYTDQPLAELQTVMIQNGTHRMEMNVGFVGGGGALYANEISPSLDAKATTGVSCNACHTVANGTPALGIAGAPGSLFIPEN